MTDAAPGRERRPRDRTSAPGQRAGTLGLAFLGCGQAAALHARTLARVAPDVALHYASRTAARARDLAARRRGAGWFDGYEAALADERVSAAVVLTPPALHLRWTLAALEAGKDVIVEKPAFPRSADFDLVSSAAAQAGRRVLVAENYAYKPLLAHLRRIFREEVLGRPLFLQVNALKHQRGDGWRADPGRSGGGALLEGGIHWLSLLARIGPGVAAVRAASPDRGSGHERSMQVLLEYEQGTVASLSYSWDVPSRFKGLRLSRIYGTEGSAVFESNGLFLAALGRRRMIRFGSRDLLGYEAMFRDFIAALRSGGTTSFTLAHARRDVELVEEAYRSAGLPAPGSVSGSGGPGKLDRPEEGGQGRGSSVERPHHARTNHTTREGGSSWSG